MWLTRIPHAQFATFRVSFRAKQAEFRTSKIPLNIIADRTLTTRIARRSSGGAGATELLLRIQ
jgi:hypothetical protein